MVIVNKDEVLNFMPSWLTYSIYIWIILIAGTYRNRRIATLQFG